VIEQIHGAHQATNQVQWSATKNTP
jgi:hypothetical protein